MSIYPKLISDFIAYAKEIAEKKERFPVLRKVGLDLFPSHPGMAYRVLSYIRDNGLLIVVKEDRTFFQLCDPKGKWKTLSKSEWESINNKKILCSRCHKPFVKESPYIRRCDSCKREDDWEFHYV